MSFKIYKFKSHDDHANKYIKKEIENMITLKNLDLEGVVKFYECYVGQH